MAAVESAVAGNPLPLAAKFVEVGSEEITEAAKELLARQEATEQLMLALLKAEQEFNRRWAEENPGSNQQLAVVPKLDVPGLQKRIKALPPDFNEWDVTSDAIELLLQAGFAEIEARQSAAFYVECLERALMSLQHYALPILYERVTGIKKTTDEILEIARRVDEKINHQLDDHLPVVDPSALRRDYLHALFETVNTMQLSGIDPKAASETNANLSLSAVYTALLTLASDTPEQGALDKVRNEQIHARRLSALEQLNRHKRLVLLGDPGSGKSTFVNFVALCLAGEAIDHPQANLALLTAPLPIEEKPYGKKEEPKPQPWDCGRLLPVRVVLRDFAARGLPASGVKATAKHLWEFIVAELETGNLKEFAPYLEKELREGGGLLLVDGLDEVPEADQRRVQIRQAVEDFARSYTKVRILVTSRTYAYQNQDWRLQGFYDTVLAPFSSAQIRSFVDHWYAQIAQVRKLNPDDAQGKATLLKNAIFKSDRLVGLAERPLLLTLMASLHAWRGGTLPEKREQLYADTVDLLLDWWESPKVVRDRAGKVVNEHPSLTEWLKVDRSRMIALLGELAFEAHANQEELTGTADIPQAALVAGLMKAATNPDARHARLVEFLRDRAGLLLPRGEGVYTFPHRTFQEYLAACYLTDYDYPDQVAELACRDLNRWREVTLLAGAKAGRGSNFAIWSLVDALCYENAPEEQTDRNSAPNARHGETVACAEGPILGAYLAAQLLVESGSLETVSERNRPKVDRLSGWLVYILGQSELPARERTLAGTNLARLGDPRFRADAWFLPDEPQLGFVEIPAGPFWMGSDRQKDKQAQDDEQPQHSVDLAQYWIARYPVTVAQFRTFYTESGYQPRDEDSLRGIANHPVVWVAWHDALAYCDWLTKKLCNWSDTPSSLREILEAGGRVTLPSEAEWEKAARGEDGRIYPWGANFDSEKANTGEGGVGTTSAVGCYPAGASPYGIQDMSGNVWEWTRSLWGKDFSKPEWDYPYNPLDLRREELKAGDDIPRVLRGGSWFDNGWNARCSYRVGDHPRNLYFYIGGFRVVVRPSSTLNSDALNL
jgi:formylglycine-generating enzyme required for sulfatase activity